MSSATPVRQSAKQRAAHASWEQTTDRSARTAPARAARKAARLENYIRQAVDQAPPLTEEQRTRLAGLLTPAGGAAA